MINIKKISGANFLFNIDSLWKKITGKNTMLYDHSYIELKENILNINIDESNIYSVIQMNREIIEEKIKKELPNITNINIKKVNKKIVKDKAKTEPSIKKQDIEKLELKKIYEKILKKYESEENKDKKSLLVALETQASFKRYMDKKENKKYCLNCSQSFKPISNETVCIVCKNEKKDRKIRYMVDKIHENPLITEEYAKKIFNVSNDIYFSALNTITDDMMIRMYNKIDISIKDEKTKIKLKDDIREYVKYKLRSDDEQIIEIEFNKMVDRMKKNIEKIYGKKVVII